MIKSFNKIVPDYKIHSDYLKLYYTDHMKSPTTKKFVHLIKNATGIFF